MAAACAEVLRVPGPAAWVWALLGCSGLVLLSGCVTPPRAGSPVAAAPAAAPTAAPAASAPGPVGTAAPAGSTAARPTSAVASPATGTQPSSPPFALVVRDAKEIKGVLTLWQKDEKVWIELSEKDFGVPMFLSSKLASGIGEAGLFGGLMMRPQLVEFRRVFNQVQLIGRNAAYVAAQGTPAERAVKAAFSPSLVGSAAVASQPHPERKTILVDASAFFLGDWLGIAPHLQRTYRQGYAFDGRNSAMLGARGKPDAVFFDTQNHYLAAQIGAPQTSMAPGAPTPTTPDTLPDPRSLFITVHYSLSRLAAQPMAPRVADPRIGHFTTVVSDFSDDLRRTPKQRWVNRWRLEKRDPAAELSEPVKPITYWIDRNVPQKYRASITAGILEWNKAFEAIGFKNAIEVKQQPDDADFDTLDIGVASVRWMTNASPTFGAIGPSHVDPRSGEILDADIGIESLSSRALRALRAQVLPMAAAARADDGTPQQAGDRAARTRAWARLLQARDAERELGVTAGAMPHDDACEHADFATEQLTYALDVLTARDGLDPAGPEAEAFTQAYLKDVTMHEVGHTLGLRHNFRASQAYGVAQLDDPAFGRSHALTGSVMEYAAINLPQPGGASTPGQAPVPFQTTLGSYDYWAIEYAYRPLPPADEAAALSRLAARSAEPQLAFATDEDAALGIDPEALTFDLGNDPLAFAERRFAVARDLLRRLETRSLSPDEDYAVLRRSVSFALRDVGRSAGILARQVGGVRTLRDFPGSGRDPLQPVPVARQRAALDLLTRGVLAPSGLVVSPALQRRLAPDYFERSEAFRSGGDGVVTDFAPQEQILDLQRAVLNQLMSDGVTQRLLTSEAKATSGEGVLRLPELQRRLDDAIWTELAPGLRGEITAPRRALQREHLQRLTALLLRSPSQWPADARALVKAEAQSLLARLDRARGHAEVGAQTQAHLLDSAALLREALAATVVRPGV